jgi:glycosyltransferase involved in cell wall biosynthesis
MSEQQKRREGPDDRDLARVAVLIPCYNDGEFLNEAISSVREEEPVEVVVIDDASTDSATLHVLANLESRGVKLIRHDRNQGPDAARYTGLHASSAPYVYPLDADDLAVEGCLGRMADRLDAAPDAAVCFGDYAEFGRGDSISAVPQQLDPFRIAYANEFGPSLFRRTALEEIDAWRPHGFDLGYEDWHIWMSLAERGAKGVHMGSGEVIYRRRMHADRRQAGAQRRHWRYYRNLRRLHPELYGCIRTYRRQSDLGPIAKLIFPIIHGWRPRFGFERRVRLWLNRRGFWLWRR